ncbi:MAG: TonB-dependent receptor plug domain-containing protein, partial [Gemmatimonadales bacterium]|nr:TonB-dependent receptor plug domain-containing protein [Gemmatimonadales bacterium]
MPFRPTLRLPTLGLGLAILASPAAAQARPDSAAARLDSVVVVGVPTPTAVGGASAVVITPARLAYPPTPAPSLSELLRKVPFVLIRQNSRGENEISVRGSDSRQAAVLIEGLPVTLGWDSRIDPSLVPLTGVQQVTVTRGLSSLVGGPNVLGGMVEFGMTPSANAGATSRRDLTVASGIDGYGAYAVSAAGGVRHATSLGMLTARVGASQRARDGVALSRNGGSTNDPAAGAADPGQDGEGRLRTNSDLHELDGFAAVRLEGPRGRHLGATVTGFDADRGVPAELHVASPRFWRYPDVSRRLAILSAGTGTGTTPLGV